MPCIRNSGKRKWKFQKPGLKIFETFMKFYYFFRRKFNPINLGATRNSSSRIDMHTMLAVHLTTAWPWPSTFWPWWMRAACVPSLVLIAQDIFRAWTHTQTHKHTKSQIPLLTLPTHWLPSAWVITPAAVWERSVAISVFVCLSVRMHISGTGCLNFIKFPVHVCRPNRWIFFRHRFEWDFAQRLRPSSLGYLSWAAYWRGKSAIYDYLVIYFEMPSNLQKT